MPDSRRGINQKSNIAFAPAVAGEENGFGRAVSRFLSARLRGERIICLSGQYPKPVPLSPDVGRAAPRFPIWPCTRWGFPCRLACAQRGGLLPHLFTLTAGSRRLAVCSLWHCPSAGLAAKLPACIRPPKRTVTRHRALWSSDFPPPRQARERFSALPKPKPCYGRMIEKTRRG